MAEDSCARGNGKLQFSKSKNMLLGTLLCQDCVSKRKLPINFSQTDLSLFEHEIERVIPATELLQLENVGVSSAGIIFHGRKILPESFVSPQHLNNWLSAKTALKFLVTNYLLKTHRKLTQNAFWCTDNWSGGYFHWITDSLPRLLVLRPQITTETLLLPYAYQKVEYINASLQAFDLPNVEFIKNSEVLFCKRLIMATHTAPTGNYNDRIIRELRTLYTNHYKLEDTTALDKVYVSRGRAQRRKISNEEEVIAVLKSYGFKVVYFEEHSFEQQAEISLNARYLVSNHGAGLTNMLFMAPRSNVFELRMKGDHQNNCYFSLASALDLKYFYQLCDPDEPGADAHIANLVVDCQQLKKNIELMLAQQL